MVEAKVNILSRNSFVDTTQGQTPQNLTTVVFQMPDGRVGNFTIKTENIGKDEEKKALAEAVKKLPTNAIESVTVDI